MFLVEDVFALFQPALLVADLGTGPFNFTVEFLAFLEKLVLGLEFGILDDVLGFATGVIGNLAGSIPGAALPRAVLEPGQAVTGGHSDQYGGQGGHQASSKGIHGALR